MTFPNHDDVKALRDYFLRHPVEILPRQEIEHEIRHWTEILLSELKRERLESDGPSRRDLRLFR